MTNKFQVWFFGIGSAVTGFLAFVANTPPEQQAGFLAMLTEAVPIQYRPQVAMWGKLISFVAGIWATHKAAQSGPQSPPKNPVE